MLTVTHNKVFTEEKLINTNCEQEKDNINLCLTHFFLSLATFESTKEKLNVKVTLVQALRLCTGRTAHRGSRGIALLFHDQRH
jgi:hypothetical protein